MHQVAWSTSRAPATGKANLLLQIRKKTAQPAARPRPVVEHSLAQLSQTEKDALATSKQDGQSESRTGAIDRVNSKTMYCISHSLGVSQPDFLDRFKFPAAMASRDEFPPGKEKRTGGLFQEMTPVPFSVARRVFLPPSETVRELRIGVLDVRAPPPVTTPHTPLWCDNSRHCHRVVAP